MIGLTRSGLHSPVITGRIAILALTVPSVLVARLQTTAACALCPVRETSLFCNLAPEPLAALNAIRHPTREMARRRLFADDERASTLFILCAGRVKLTAMSRQGRSLLVRMAGPGEVLGLHALLANGNYGVSAVTVEDSQLALVARHDFLQFLERYGQVALRVTQHLSMELQRAYRQISRVALAPTVRAKLAAFLLDSSGHDLESAGQGGSTSLDLHATQEEIADLLGTTRETVCRILNEFRRKGWVGLDAHNRLLLLNPRGLDSLLKP